MGLGCLSPVPDPALAPPDDSDNITLGDMEIPDLPCFHGNSAIGNSTIHEQCPNCSFVPTDKVLAHPLARALARRAQPNECLQCLANAEQDTKYETLSDMTRHEDLLLEFKEAESIFIDHKVRNNRVGSASGVYRRHLGDTSRSHTKITQVFVGGPTSGRLVAAYYNRAGSLTTCPFGYHDMNMVRLSA